MQKGFALILVLVGVVVVVVASGGIYWAQKINKEPSTNGAVLHLKQLSDTEKIIDPKNSADQNQDETANWKTYKNVEYNYEIQYPNNWNKTEASADGTQTMFGRKLDKGELQKVTFTHTFDIGDTPSVEAFVQVAVTDNSSNLTLSQIASKNYPRTKISDLTFGEKTAKLIHPVCCNYPEFGYILIQNNKYLYKITFLDISSNDSNVNYNQAKSADDQILSTLKFLDQQQDGESGIMGKIVLGPSCPAEGPGMGNECQDKPYQATVAVKTSDGVKEITRFTSDTQGNFKVSLAPDNYLLESVSNNRFPFAKPQSVTVVKGEFTNVTISYDTGIR